MSRELRSILVAFKLTLTEATQLDRMVERGRHEGRGTLARRLIRDVLDDDARAHGEQPLPRE